MKRVPVHPHKGVHQGSIGTYSLSKQSVRKAGKRTANGTCFVKLGK